MKRGRVLLALLIVTLLHVAVLPDLRVAGVRADGFVVLTIAVAMLDGPERGAVLGFVTGLVADLFLQTPYGLSALTYSLVGFAVGILQQAVIRAAWWIPVVTGFAGAGLAVVLFALSGAVVGQSGLVEPRLLLVALVVAAFAALLVMPTLRLARWALGPPDPRRA